MEIKPTFSIIYPFQAIVSLNSNTFIACLNFSAGASGETSGSYLKSCLNKVTMKGILFFLTFNMLVSLVN